MNLISTEEKIQLLKNLLVDPDDWISREILNLAYEPSEFSPKQTWRSRERSVASERIKELSDDGSYSSDGK